MTFTLERNCGFMLTFVRCSLKAVVNVPINFFAVERGYCWMLLTTSLAKIWEELCKGPATGKIWEGECLLHLHFYLPWKLCNFTVNRAGHIKASLSILHAQWSMPPSHLLSLHISHVVRFSHAVQWLKFKKSLFHMISVPARGRQPLTAPLACIPVLFYWTNLYSSLSLNLHFQTVREAGLIALKPAFCKPMVSLP